MKNFHCKNTICSASHTCVHIAWHFTMSVVCCWTCGKGSNQNDSDINTTLNHGSWQKAIGFAAYKVHFLCTYDPNQKQRYSALIKFRKEGKVSAFCWRPKFGTQSQSRKTNSKTQCFGGGEGEGSGRGRMMTAFCNSKQVQLKEESDEACFCLKMFTRADCECGRTTAPT